MRGIEQIPWLYDGLTAMVDPLGLARWRRELTRTARGRTLEVGCGTGRNLPLYPPDLHVIGLDPDEAALQRARHRAPAIPLVRGRVEALPFPDRCFDTVVSSLVFCSVEEPRKGLAEIRRVLAPDGELRMLEHVRARGRCWAGVQDRLQPAWTWLTGGCRPNRDIEAMVREAGFRIEGRERKARHVLRRFVARPLS